MAGAFLSRAEIPDTPKLISLHKNNRKSNRDSTTAGAKGERIKWERLFVTSQPDGPASHMERVPVTQSEKDR